MQCITCPPAESGPNVESNKWAGLGIALCDNCIAEIVGYWAEVARSRRRQVPRELSWAVFERDNFTCKECGARQMLEPDHVVPASRGGLTTMGNLQTLCRRCNQRKGAA